MASAYNAYLKSTDPVERGAALFLIGRDYDRHDKQKEALAAFEAGLAFTQSACGRRARRAAAPARRVPRHQGRGRRPKRNAARACLRFNEKIATKGDLSYGSFVRSEPQLDGIVTARGDTLCLDGMKHGGNYNVEVLAGLPAATGETTAGDLHDARRRSRPQAVRSAFPAPATCCRKQGTAGLPVTTVNVDKVKLRLLRVNERNLVPSIDAERLTMSFSSYEVDEVINRTGSLVWEGEMAIAGERNRPVATAIPLKDMLREKGPGVYLVVAERTDLMQDEYRRAGNELGARLRSRARRLQGHRRHGGRCPLARRRQAAVRASRFGSMPATTASSPRRPAMPAGSRASRAGLLRGSGGDEPFVVTAHGPDNDFNFLEIGRPAFDLSDRGVSGRPQPGPVDAFLYTDRGIYRPGETVELVALVRDDKADAISGLPVGVAAVAAGRGRGREAAADRRSSSALIEQSFALPRDARIGAWRVELRLDPKAPPIGTAEFRVEDFVPPQLKVALAAADGPIRPGEAFPVDVDARYYYGAPGAGLGDRGRGDDRARRRPLPERARLPVRPGRRGIHRRSPRHRGADDRRRRQGAAVGRR